MAVLSRGTRNKGLGLIQEILGYTESLVDLISEYQCIFATDDGPFNRQHREFRCNIKDIIKYYETIERNLERMDDLSDTDSDDEQAVRLI